MEANFTSTFRVHEAINQFHILKADLQFEVVDGLCELVDWDRLRMVRIDIAEGLAQISEAFLNLRRDE